MELLKAKLPREIQEASRGVGRELRWKSAEKIAQSFTAANLLKMRDLEKDLLNELSDISDGQTPGYDSLLRWERQGMKSEKRGDPTPAELAQILIQLSQYLTQDQIRALVNVFDTYQPGFFNQIYDELSGVWNGNLPAVFQDALDYSHAQTKKIASQQGMAATFATTSPAPITFSTALPFIRSYYDVAYQRVTSKLSTAMKSEFLGELVDGLSNGDSWTTIARNVHRVTGIGPRYHWKRLVRTEMVIAAARSHDAEFQRAGIQYVFFSPNPGACPVCKPLRGYYLYANSPVEPIHPNCRCKRSPFYSLPKGAVLRQY